MKGYLNNLEATNEVLNHGGWMRTGDICSIDAGGSLSIHGKLKEMIKYNGFPMLPAEVEAALIYQLSGDFNPLHADPAVAQSIGFDRPVLLGLCTMAIAACSLPVALRAGDFSTLTHMQQRFSAPIYPGETIRTEIWDDGENISFHARALESDVIVLNSSLAQLS